MKKWIKLVFFLFVLSSFKSDGDYLFETNCEDEIDSIALRIHLSVVYKEVPINNVDIKVYLGNEEVKSGITNQLGIFNVNLLEDQEYSIKISKAGYQSKLVQVYTAVPPMYVNSHYKFAITIEMTKEDKLLVNEDAFDFPAALIAFDEKKEKFDYCKKYTATLKEEKKEIKQKKQKFHADSIIVQPIKKD